MINCPTCGAQNDPGNRFCDQCGIRIDSAAPTIPPAAAAVAPVTGSAAITCPNCGAAVLPGEAFCDNCGAALNALPPPSAPVSPDAPTMMAQVSAPTPAPVAPVVTPTATGGGLLCRVCGHQNLPGETFCDTCGADLTTVAPTPVAPVPPVAPSIPITVAAPVGPVAVPMEPEAAPTIIVPPVGPVEPEAAPTIVVPPVRIDVDAERKRLESLVATQRAAVAQLEKTAAIFPAGAIPSYIVMGLDESKRALAQAETELAALPTGPDPAEVARLEGLVATHRAAVTQLDQTVALFPPGATPAYIAMGLDEAKRALAQAEADLATLVGSAATAPTPVAVAPTPVAVAPPPAVTAPAPAAPPAPAPRLVVVEGGHEMKLPTDKSEIILGREDPVSNIYPEVDLTPYGGETGGVSRQHARITVSGNQWSITDLNSTNYTRVDGVRIEPNTPTPIQNGSRVQLGRIAMVFHV